MAIVTIPMLSPKQAKPLQGCIAHAARETGVSEHTTALVVSYFLERLADEVSLGRVVRIPGFGIFAAKHYKGADVMAPRFSAARPFRLQVRHGAPKTDFGSEALRRHTHQTGSSKRSSMRVFTAQAAYRDRIREQIAQAGADDD
jgi:nucleoid DNA-binding protein